MKTYNSWSVAAVVLLVAVLVGCDTVDDDAPDDARMSIVLTDAPFPFDLVERADVTILGISAESESGGQVELADDEFSLNLLDLAGGVTALLASNISVPPGLYNKILLNITAASVELTDGRLFELNVPSGRIQVLVNARPLDAGDFATVLLDFDVSQSFVVQGNPDTPAGIQGFTFTPVVRSVGFLKVDDVDGRAELQGVIDVLGPNFIEMGGNRFFIAQDTEIEGGFGALSEGMVIEVEFIQRSDGLLIATEVDVVSDGEDDVYNTSGTVDGIETDDGATFVTVGALTFRIAPDETEFEGVTGIEGLVIGQSNVEVDYFVEASTGDLVALKIEVTVAD